MAPPGRWASWVLIAATTVLFCLPVLRGDFLADDFGYVQLLGGKPLGELVRFGDISEGIWGHPLDEPRPLFALTYKLGWLMSGADPRGFLALSLALHATCALLVFAIARRVAGDRSFAPLLAGLLFGLMPVHSEPIAWITGKVDSLPTLFYLGSLALFLRYREAGRATQYRLSLAVFALGLLAKEILLTLPALLLAWDALFGSGATFRERTRAWLLRACDALPFFLFVLLYVTLRRLAFGSFAREGRAGTGLLGELVARQDWSLRHLLLPFPSLLAHEQPDPATAILASAIVLAVLAALVDLARRPREKVPTLLHVLFFGLVFYGLTTLPLLLTYRSARHLYLPSAGVAIALALLLFPRSERPAFPRLVAAALLLGVFTWSLLDANGRWTRAGVVSRTVRTDIERLARTLPKGAIAVLAGVPVSEGDVLVWNSALPFALRPPFVSRDVLADLRLIEHPLIFSRRPRAWWPARKPALEALVADPAGEERDLYLFFWNPGKNAVVLRKARRTAWEWRATIEGVLGNRIESVGDTDERTGAGLVIALATAVRSP